MIKTLRNQTIALAGLSQSISLVQKIARTGSADRDDTGAVVASIFRLDADDVPAVYRDLSALKTGFTALERQLDGPSKVDPEQARYASVIVFLERKLAERPDYLRTIGEGVKNLTEQAKENGVLDEVVLEGLGDVYQKTISQLKPRVVVAGEQRHLANPENANRIRALLLAAVRAAVLWRQCGGSRFKLLFYRGRLQKVARELLKEI